jgi:hypothetical protein
MYIIVQFYNSDYSIIPDNLLVFIFIAYLSEMFRPVKDLE